MNRGIDSHTSVGTPRIFLKPVFYTECTKLMSTNTLRNAMLLLGDGTLLSSLKQSFMFAESKVLSLNRCMIFMIEDNG